MGKSLIYIKEFWEFSKNIHGQAKWVHDSINTLTKMNRQNGYAQEGQWVLTQKGKYFIQEINDDKFIGIDEDGNDIEGNTNDIIRTLTKDEIINSVSLKNT
jgi:hypothetical protein